MKNIIERLKVLPADKRNDAFLFKKIQKSLESKKDTNISVDCGK